MTRKHRIVALGFVVSLAAIVGVGCEGIPGHFPGGTGASIDKFVYTSTSELPQTVTLFDTRTGQAIWSKDVPVGHQLVVRFYEATNQDPVNPDRMAWQVMETTRWGGSISNSFMVPPSNARRLETSFRAPGEMAPVASAQEPAPPPEAVPPPDAPTEEPPAAEVVPAAPNEVAPAAAEPTPPAPEPSPTPEPTPEPAPSADPKPAPEPPVDLPPRS